MLYHRKVYYPSELDTYCNNILKRNVPIKFSKHFENRVVNAKDKSRMINYNYLFKKIRKTKKIKPFEVKTNEFGTVTKFCFRISYNKKKDVIVVMSCKEDCNCLVTAWLNNKEDNHETLDFRKYYAG